MKLEQQQELMARLSIMQKLSARVQHDRAVWPRARGQRGGHRATFSRKARPPSTEMKALSAMTTALLAVHGENALRQVILHGLDAGDAQHVVPGKQKRKKEED